MKPDEEKDLEPIGASFRREWQRLGLLPPDGTPIPACLPLDPAQIVREQRMARFRDFCPPRFQEKIDRALIPNLPAWDDADKWTGSHPGVWLWSHDTGEAKSRMLWRKFGQLHVERGLVVARITGANLAEDYHDAFNKSRTAGFYSSLEGFDILMLDDLDKMTLPKQGQGFAEADDAARNARMIREVFDRFYEQKASVLVTANESIAWFGQCIGPSTERRMRETCREIAF